MTLDVAPVLYGNYQVGKLPVSSTVTGLGNINDIHDGKWNGSKSERSSISHDIASTFHEMRNVERISNSIAVYTIRCGRTPKHSTPTR